MSLFSKIMLPTDFSSSSEHAKLYAYALAGKSEGEIHFAHAVDTQSYVYSVVPEGGAMLDQSIQEIHDSADEHLAKDVEEAGSKGIKSHAHRLEGYPPKKIDELARELDCDLIIIGTHGHSGFNKLFFGSTCSKLTRITSIPVLTIKDPEHEFVDDAGAIHIEKILCPQDLTDLSREALPIAANLCRQFGAKLVLFHVVDSRIEYPVLMPSTSIPIEAQLHKNSIAMLEKLQAEYSDIDTEIEVTLGIPGREINKAVKEMDVDLTVMTTHGRAGISHAILGSTAEKVALHAPCPVLTVKPQSVLADSKERLEAVNAPDAVVI